MQSDSRRYTLRSIRYANIKSKATDLIVRGIILQHVKESIIKTLPYLRRYSYALSGNAEQAEAMVYECVACAMDLTQFWEPGQSEKVWLFSVFHNLHNDFLNKNRARWTAAAISPQLSGNGLDLSQLIPQQKQAFLLISLEGFGYKEVASILNISLGELLALIHGGRKVLRAQLKKSQLSRPQPEPAQ